jgi:hypothetical protein
VTATGDRVWPEGYDPEWVHDCPMCERRAKELEAAAGERCAGCLERFDKPYRQPSPEDPSRCDSCQRIAQYRATTPASTPMYGKPVNG